MNTINIVYCGYIGIRENKMETTIVGLYRDYNIRLRAEGVKGYRFRV